MAYVQPSSVNVVQQNTLGSDVAGGRRSTLSVMQQPSRSRSGRNSRIRAKRLPSAQHGLPSTQVPMAGGSFHRGQAAGSVHPDRAVPEATRTVGQTENHTCATRTMVSVGFRQHEPQFSSSHGTHRVAPATASTLARTTLKLTRRPRRKIGFSQIDFMARMFCMRGDHEFFCKTSRDVDCLGDRQWPEEFIMHGEKVFDATEGKPEDCVLLEHVPFLGFEIISPDPEPAGSPPPFDEVSSLSKWRGSVKPPKSRTEHPSQAAPPADVEIPSSPPPPFNEVGSRNKNILSLSYRSKARDSKKRRKSNAEAAHQAAPHADVDIASSSPPPFNEVGSRNNARDSKKRRKSSAKAAPQAALHADVDIASSLHPSRVCRLPTNNDVTTRRLKDARDKKKRQSQVQHLAALAATDGISPQSYRRSLSGDGINHESYRAIRHNRDGHKGHKSMDPWSMDGKNDHQPCSSARHGDKYYVTKDERYGRKSMDPWSMESKAIPCPRSLDNYGEDCHAAKNAHYSSTSIRSPPRSPVPNGSSYNNYASHDDYLARTELDCKENLSLPRSSIHNQISLGSHCLAEGEDDDRESIFRRVNDRAPWCESSTPDGRRSLCKSSANNDMTHSSSNLDDHRSRTNEDGAFSASCGDLAVSSSCGNEMPIAENRARMFPLSERGCDSNLSMAGA